MSPQFKTKKFDALKAKWDKKLLDSGFKDIEDKNERLKSHSQVGRNVDEYYDREVFYSAKEEYFRLAGFFYHDHKFDNDLDRELWLHHCDGLSIREISKIMKTKRIGLKKSGVFKRIKKLVDLMLERTKK